MDEDYRGNVGVVLFNHSDKPFNVSRGDRIAQLICQQICYPELEEVKVGIIQYYVQLIKSVFKFQLQNWTVPICSCDLHNPSLSHLYILAIEKYCKITISLNMQTRNLKRYWMTVS